jgi:hypothetical protein
VSCWSHEKACRWLSQQLRTRPHPIEPQIEEQVAQGHRVETVESLDWSTLLPRLDGASRTWLQDILQRPRLTPAEEQPLWRQWIDLRQRIRDIFADSQWRDQLDSRLQQLVEAGQRAGPADEPSLELGQRAADLQRKIARLQPLPHLEGLLELGTLTPRMLQILGPDMLNSLSQTGRLLDPLLGRRLEEAAALCWNVFAEPLHFLVLVQRPICGLMAAVDRLDCDQGSALDARAGWFERLELVRFQQEQKELTRLSAALRKKLGRRPWLEELASPLPQPLSWILDHWELRPKLIHLGPIQERLTRQESAQARPWRRPHHTPAEVRVLLGRYGLGSAPQSLEELSKTYNLPAEVIARLEDLATRKRESG